MNRENKKTLTAGAALLAAFLVWTGAVKTVDLRPIGPGGSAVGFGGLNGWFHSLTGVHLALYDATDLLSILPLALVAGFGLLGLVQWVKRRDIRKVDGDILALGAFYAVVGAVFCFFEVCPLNYRPILIEGVLEASYPSSTTMLVMCVLPTAVMQLRARISSPGLGRCAALGLTLLGAFMVAARLVSGVHWLTDIVGGALFSAGLVLVYAGVCRGLKGKG